MNEMTATRGQLDTAYVETPTGSASVCTIVVAVLAAGRTGQAAPGSERANRLHSPQVRAGAS